MRSRSVCFPARRPIRLGAPSDSAPSIGSNASSSGSAGYSLLLMEAVSTTRPESPLAQLLRARTQEVLSSWEASGEMPASEPGRTALRRFLSALDELAEAAEALATPRKEALALVPKPPILLATQDAELARVLRQTLDPHARVEVAADPQLARRKAIARTPAVLFASGTDAPETLRRLRELHP